MDSVLRPLASLFDFSLHESAAIIGSGGKTTLLWYLAEYFRHERILVTPATKLFLPNEAAYDRLYDPASFAALEHSLPGISIAGHLHDTTSTNTATPSPASRKSARRPVDNPDAFLHKLTPIDPDLLASKKHFFDKVLMECDGARNLPLKGWAPYEPLIYDFTDHTIAVIPLWVTGSKASKSIIHRPEIFYSMAGCSPGDVLTVEHLAHVVAHPQGLLAKSKGTLSLLLHYSDPEEIFKARKLVSALPASVFERCSRIVAGSARLGTGIRLWPAN